MQSAAPELARSALDAAPDAMIIIDDAGVLRYANRQVSALFGFAHDELIGQPVESLMPERFRAGHVAHRHGYERNVRIRPMGVGLDLFGRRKDGSEFPIEISLSPIQDGARLLVAAAIRDVTDRKRVEAELIIARQSAERARESADRANQGKSRFLATASHDLRQPLQTLSLLNGTLRRTVSDPDAVNAVSQQEHVIGAMSRLLNALLDISKLESGAIKPDLTDFRIEELFEDLRQEFSEVAADKGLKLQVVSCDACVRSDRALVEQILKNIISNAIKYTRQGWVLLRCVPNQSSIVRIEVLDSGIGIPADQLRFIYDEFYQVGVPTNTSREGYGLGLSIVQRLVTLLKLALDVKSEVGKGSLFSLDLPASDVVVRQAPAAANAARAPVSEDQYRVLLVEDDASVRDATRMLLRVEGYQVTAVASLAEALEQARQALRLDLLISDYHLREGETGIQVIAALREELRIPLRAVLVTGDTSSAVRELPVDQNLRIASKPIQSEQFLAILKDLLGT
jgi:PAS domain S-box-containing protein